MSNKAQSQNGIDVVDRVKTILGMKDLTLHQVSRRLAKLYGSSSHYLISHSLYQELRLEAFTPSLHQLCALSWISGYRLFDWLRVFGFSPGGALRIQVSRSSKRTILLDTSLDNGNVWIPWFQDVPSSVSSTGTVPLGQLVKLSQPRHLSSLSHTNMQGFLYAKVGRQDALAFPDLLPGSIVRVNPKISEGPLGRTTEHIFLIEHSKGLSCCRVHWTGEKRIIPISKQLPYAHIELQIPDEARILGVADMEIRRLCNVEQPEVPRDLASRWAPEPWDQRAGGLGGLLRRARGKMALSFREASVLSRKIADTLGDERYFAAPGTLSDYEARDTPPRHIHKVLALCLLYGVQFSSFLNAAGINGDELGKNAMPAKLLAAPEREDSLDAMRSTESLTNNPTVDSLVARFGGLPLFLRGSLKDISGISQLSLRDFFWAGEESNILHPYLEGGLLLIVNRHKKKAIHSRSMPLWRQPLYVLNTRDGRYICACCSLEHGVLVVRPYSADFQRAEQFRNRQDAEVIGQVVAIARRLN